MADISFFIKRSLQFPINQTQSAVLIWLNENAIFISVKF